jgi:hypothetical protein
MPGCMRAFHVRNKGHTRPPSQNGTSTPPPLVRGTGVHRSRIRSGIGTDVALWPRRQYTPKAFGRFPGGRVRPENRTPAGRPFSERLPAMPKPFKPTRPLTACFPPRPDELSRDRPGCRSFLSHPRMRRRRTASKISVFVSRPVRSPPAPASGAERHCLEQAEAAREWVIGCLKDGMQPLADPVPIEVEAVIATSWGG